MWQCFVSSERLIVFVGDVSDEEKRQRQDLRRPLVAEAFMTSGESTKTRPVKQGCSKQSMAEGIPFPSASGRFWGAGGGGGQSLAAAGSSTSCSSSSSPSPTSDHLPLEDAGVLAPHGEQVVVAVREAHIGHVTPVAVVHQARGLEERKHNDQ